MWGRRRPPRCWGSVKTPYRRWSNISSLSVMEHDSEPHATDTHRVRNLYRLTVAQAAERLGITQDAVRQRIRRGSIEHDKDENGRVYVYLDPTHTEHDTVQDGVRDELVEELRDRIRYLEEESKRKDAILLRMAERIPELEPAAAPEPRDSSPEAPSERGAGGDASESSQETAQRRSWLLRWFGF